ncbi:AFG1-like ATPase-domain-containing protein, partial [Delphinella strobiligena]
SSIHNAYQTLLTRGRLVPNPAQAALVQRLANLQTRLAPAYSTAPHQKGKGVYIYGNVGTGKSRIADLFASTLSPDISSRRIHFHEFMMDIHMRLHHARSSPTYSGDPLVAIGRQVSAESRVLCFDEFQVTDIADAMILKRLFGAIWGCGGVMVATSNRHPNNLYEKGLNRSLFLPFIDELQRRCEVWEMQGDLDYRMVTDDEEKSRQTVFFSDAAEFSESLEEVSQAARLVPQEIPVMMNRVLNVEGARVGK